MYNGGGATKFYRQMHDAEMAKAMAMGKSGLGIADLIIQQFSKNVDANAANEALAKAAEERGEVMPSPIQSSHRSHVPLTTTPFIGPPAPPAQLSRYSDMSPVGKQVAKMARLRGMAKLQDPAVADTLARFEFELGSAAVKSGVDPALLLAVVMEESGGDPAARSPQGAVGLMQLMPGTAAEVGVSDATSPSQNLHGGADYLARMLRKYEGQLDLALAAYNAGPGNVDRAGRKIPDFPETQRYVERVQKLYQSLSDGTKFADKASIND